VMPVSSTAGLVQWVDGVTPVFHLYQAWRTRQRGRDKEKDKEKEKGPPLPQGPTPAEAGASRFVQSEKEG
jgi:hypothetical protein